MLGVIKRSIKNTAYLLGAILLCACSYHQNPNIRPDSSIGGGVSVSESDKQIVALAFLAYVGDNLFAPDDKVDQLLEPCIEWELSRQSEMLANRFSLAWGPSVYRFDLAFLDDNMMYAVDDQDQPGHVVIAIRGTNPDGLLDWLVEDFYVSKTASWKYAGPASSTRAAENARLSEGTEIGLNALQIMRGDAAKSGELQTLRDYLAKRVSEGSLNKISVTGHSLAGALAPVFALWLDDTRAQWDASGKVGIRVIPIAGATPGNADFAAYYDSSPRLSTLRLHNPFDLVPQAWFLPSMRELKDIYITPTQKIKPSILEMGVFDLGIELAKDKDYQQIEAQQKALAGVLNPNKAYSKYLDQGAWQHHCGYYNSLDMTDRMLNVNSSCLTQKTCEAEPDNPQCKSLTMYACDSVPIPPH